MGRITHVKEPSELLQSSQDTFGEDLILLLQSGYSEVIPHGNQIVQATDFSNSGNDLQSYQSNKNPTFQSGGVNDKPY